MLHVSARHYAAALHTCTQTPRRRLHDIDPVRGPHALHYWHLGAALATVTPTRFRHVPDLVNAAVYIPRAGPLPRDPDRAAMRLEKWCNARHRKNQSENAQWAARMQAAQRAFAQTIADNIQSPLIARQAERLRRIFILDSAILRYVFADHDPPPDWAEHCTAFALRQAAPDLPTTPSNPYLEGLYQ